MKIFEENLTNNKSNQDYLKCKRDLNYIDKIRRYKEKKQR